MKPVRPKGIIVVIDMSKEASAVASSQPATEKTSSVRGSAAGAAAVGLVGVSAHNGAPKEMRFVMDISRDCSKG
jgi:hypothetical protein